MKNFPLSVLGLLCLVTFPLFSHAQISARYPAIGEERAASDTFELRRLMCKSCSRVIGVIYVRESDTFFAELQNGDVWQINRKGFLVDVVRGLGQIPDAGVYFSEKTYIDWIYTGDKSSKQYKQIIDADTLTEDRFNQYLNTAAIQVSDTDYGGRKLLYYLRFPDGWILLKKSAGDTDLRMYRGKQVIYHQPRHAGNNEKSPFIRLVNLNNRYYDWKNRNNPLFIQRFKKQGRVTSGFKNRSSTSWNGIYGTGYFQINHHQEKINFSALHWLLDGKQDAAEIDIYQFPPDQKAATDLAFYGVYGHRRLYAENEMGFYVVRPAFEPTPEAIALAQAQGISFGAYNRLFITYLWAPVFLSGGEKKEQHPLQSTGKLRRLVYFNAREEDINLPLTDITAARSRSIPSLIDFYIPLPKGIGEGDPYLHINDHFYRIKPAENLHLLLDFDEAETAAAFRQLHVHPQQEIQLAISADWLENGLSLSIDVRSGNKIIPLHKVQRAGAQLLSDYLRDDLRQSYEKDRFTRAFKRAVENPADIAEFLSLTENITATSSFNKNHAFDLASFTVKLMIANLQLNNAAAAEKLFYHYVDIIYPKTGHHVKALDIASMALALGLTHTRPEVIHTAFDKLLGGKPLDIQTLNNDILLYNLACYYARSQQKPELLQAARQAVKYGKTAAQFLADEDFTEYWNDADFLAAIAH